MVEATLLPENGVIYSAMAVATVRTPRGCRVILFSQTGRICRPVDSIMFGSGDVGAIHLGVMGRIMSGDWSWLPI